MSIVVLLILAVVWAVFLIPQVVRMRAEQSPADSIGAFHRQLSVLSRTTPSAQRAASSVPASAVPAAHPAAVSYAARSPRALSRSKARKRRRDILVGLLVAMSGTLVLGLTPWLRSLLAVHVALDLLFAVYVTMLVRARTVSEERRTKVRFLPAAGSAEPALLLRRSAN